jgi:molybdenum cofactor biosynthesis protein B
LPAHAFAGPRPARPGLGGRDADRQAPADLTYTRPVSHIEHKATSPSSVRCAILTVSDTRTATTDTSGHAIAALLADAGHTIVSQTIVRDEPTQVRDLVQTFAHDERVQAIITTGGTGITSRDSTYEAVTSLLTKQLDGFGELFRMLSVQEIGAAAMMSRACAGVFNRRIVFCLPGSEHAVRLAMTRLILPELGHLIREVSR